MNEEANQNVIKLCEEMHTLAKNDEDYVGAVVILIRADGASQMGTYGRADAIGYNLDMARHRLLMEHSKPKTRATPEQLKALLEDAKSKVA